MSVVKHKFAKPPFTYAGGKSRHADLVWQMFGKVQSYVEPFFGSGAILLRNPHPPAREVVGDLNPLISNFWRALQLAPLEVARWADFPTSHMDLHARHKWLVEWAEKCHDILWDDPDFYDARAAGWYCWGLSNWIQDGFCSSVKIGDKRPHMERGVMAVNDKVPAINNVRLNMGCGVRQHSKVHDKRTYIRDAKNGFRELHQSSNLIDSTPMLRGHTDTYQGVNCASAFEEDGEMPFDGSRLQPWFMWLHHRLKRVNTWHRSYEKLLSDTVTMKATEKNGKGWSIGVFLDPPYRLDGGNRANNIYPSDRDGSSTEAAIGAYEWAVENGSDERLKIAYCCRRGDFPLPDGWTDDVRNFAGVKKKERRKQHKEQIMFSPGCGKGVANQDDLFGGEG